MSTGIVKSLPKLMGFTLFLISFCLVSLQAVDLDENFDVGTIGQKTDFFTDAAGDTVYSIESYGAGQGARLYIASGSDGWGTWGGRKVFSAPLVKGDEIWVRVRTKFPIGFNYNANPFLKFLRLYMATGSGGLEGYNDVYIRRSDNADGQGRTEPFYYTKEAPGAAKVVYFGSDPDDRIQLGQWETYEWYVKFSDETADTNPTTGARTRIWKNGVLLADITSVETLQTATSECLGFLLFTYWNGFSPQTQEMYIDDLRITSITPGIVDAAGNPMIGMGDEKLPKAPTNFGISQ